MTAQEFLERVKLYEKDHDPDGWPCVQTSELTEAARIIEELLKENEQLREYRTSLIRVLSESSY